MLASGVVHIYIRIYLTLLECRRVFRCRLRISVQISKELRGKIGSKAPRRGKKGGNSKAAPPRAGGTRGGVARVATSNDNGAGTKGAAADGDRYNDGGAAVTMPTPPPGMGSVMAGMAAAAAATAAATTLPDESPNDALRNTNGTVRCVRVDDVEVTVLLSLPQHCLLPL